MMNTIANKTALYITVTFALLLTSLSWLFFSLSTNQFFSYIDVNRHVEMKKNTADIAGHSTQIAFFSQLSQKISDALQQEGMQLTPQVELQIIKKTLAVDIEHFVENQGKDWPFLLFVVGPSNHVLVASDKELVGMLYQEDKQQLTLTNKYDEIMLPIEIASKKIIHDGYFALMLPLPATDNIDTIEFSIKRTILILFVVFLIVGVWVIWFIIQRALRPIKQLNDATSSLIKGLRPEALTVVGDDEIAQLTQRFNQAISALKQQEALRKQNLTNVSHELRTPLTVIMGKLDAWRDGLINDEQQIQHLLIQEVQQLSLLVNDLQDLALVQVNELNLHRESFNIHAVLTELIKASEHTFSRQNTQFTNKVDHELFLNADMARFKQIINNLCINAIKHNPDNIELTFSAVQNEQSISVQVSDNGVGISKKEITLIFERHTQFSDDTSGLGLGLSIVKNLITLHDGTISVTSKPGQTCFNLSFPRAV